MNSHLDQIANFSVELLKSSEPCIWVPSDRLVFHQVPVPSAPRRKWPDLLPWMLEDKILQSPDDMHFVIAGKDQNKLNVLVVARSQIQAWKETVEASGLASYRLIPDYMALPWHSGLLCVAKHVDRILVRCGEFEGFSASANLAWHMLADLMQKTGSSLSLSGLSKDELPTLFKEKFAEKVEIVHPSIDWQYAGYPANANLLKGDFALASTSNDLMPWLKTAALFVLALVLGFATLNMQNKRLEEEIAALRDQNISAFYSLFPGLTIRSGNIRTTLESYISNRFRQRESLQSEIMQALTVLDRAMSSCNCDLQGLTWRNGSLELILPQSVATVAEQWDFEGYEKRISVTSEDSLALILSPEYRR
jgi:type II secretion system protein L